MIFALLHTETEMETKLMSDVVDFVWKRFPQNKGNTLDEAATKYYLMEDERGQFVSMPLMCNQADKVAIIFMHLDLSDYTFGAYINGIALRSEEQAQELINFILPKYREEIGCVLYHLHSERKHVDRKDFIGGFFARDIAL